MDELVIIIITVIKLAYTRNSMKKKEINKLDLTKELRIEVFFIINATNTKRNGTYNTFHGPLSQKWIDGRY